MTQEIPMMENPAMAQSTTNEQKPKKAKKRYMPFVQLAIVLGLVAGMYISFNMNVLSQSTPVPMKVGQLVRYQFEVEKDAIPQIRHLYETDIQITKAYVAHYENAGTTLNVWYAEAADQDNLRKMFSDLIKQIETGQNKTLSDLVKQDIEGMTVYSVKRDGEPQFFYQTGKKFIWLGIQGNSSKASQILIDAMRSVTGSHDEM